MLFEVKDGKANKKKTNKQTTQQTYKQTNKHENICKILSFDQSIQKSMEEHTSTW